MEAFRSMGFQVVKTEHWNPWSKVRVDFGHFADAIAWKPQEGIVAIQATGPTGHAKHRQKILEDERAAPLAFLWCRSRGRIQIWSWRKKRGRWQSNHEEIIDRDFNLDHIKKIVEVKEWTNKN